MKASEAALQIGRFVSVIGLLLAITLAQGCGGGASIQSAPIITAVSVSPQNPTIAAGQQQLFSAEVSGTGNFSTAVVWLVNEVPGGNLSIGTISTGGNYSAPANFNAAFTVTINAVSTQDSTKSGTAQANLVVGLVSGVTIAPQAQNVYAGGNQLFMATVQGTGNINPNVTWSVNGVPGGNSAVGTMGTGPSAFYTAPDVIPNPASVTITATSVQDTTKSGTAVATVMAPPLGIISVNVTPTSVNMPASQTQTFTVNVIGVGNFNSAVTWSVGPAGVILPNYGTISPGGLYTPPNNLTDPTPINITVTSVADPSKSSTAAVQVFPTPVITSLSPNPAQAGDMIDINGTNLDSVIGIQFTGPNNLILPVPTFGTEIPVPLSAVSGPVSVITQLPGFAPVVTNSLQFTRIPALRIRAANRDLSTGESTQFSYRILGMPSAQTIEWTADVGTIDGSGNYQAPGGVPSDTFAHIQGCISATQICQSEILGLHPFRITPYPASVALAGSLLLQSVLRGATWTELAGGGSLTPNGLYTAGTTIASSGGIPVSATLNGATENATVGVTGGVPGVVSEVSDYIDYTLPLPLGTANEQVAVSGTHLYALASGNLADPVDRTYFWIDVYDISDPIHPVWVDAVETALRSPMYTSGQYMYQVGGGLIAVFYISGTTPMLIAEAAIPPVSNVSNFDGIVWVWPATGWSGSQDQVTVEQFDLRSGNIVQTNFQLPGPTGAGPSSSVTSLPMGTDTRLFVLNLVNAHTSSASTELDTFDLTTSPPSLLQAQTISAPFSYSSFLGSILVVGAEIFDVSSGLPVQVSTLPPLATGNPVGFNGTQLLTGSLGLLVTDLTDLSQPKLTGVLFDPTSGSTGAWAGQYVITGNGDIREFDASPTGGALVKATPLGPFLASVVYDQLIYQSHLFEATETDHNAFVSILDLTTNPLSEVSEFDTGSANPIAVQATGSTMYVGTDQSLLVVDISNPASPVQITSMTGAVSALSISGNYLYEGTADGHLVAFNISQSAAPVQVSSQTIPSPAITIRASNNLLFIADDTSGLLTYSLANPSAPTLLSQFQPATAIGDVAIDGTLVLLATSDQGMVIANIANPSQPVQVGQAILPAAGITTASAIADGITFTNKVAYVGTWADGGILYGFDYSTAAHPRMVAVMPEGALCDSVLTLQNDGMDLFDGGALDAFPFLDIDLSQPRNVINFYSVFASAINAGTGNACDVTFQTVQSRRTRASYAAMRARLRKRK
jgi:hypothetical protein